ncbi:MAG: Wzz/FepE/Etk N-terminal domain-containing protein [Solirubrobacterales bacterium]
MSLKEILSVVWKRRLVVVLVLVLCVVGAGLYAISQPKKDYASYSTIAFLPDPETKTVTSPESLSSLLSTYAVVAQSERTLDAAEKILGHPLSGNVIANVAGGSLVMGITSEAPTADGAAETASAATKALIKAISGNGVFKPNVVNRPLAASAPMESRSTKLVIAVAVVVGLIGGVLLALLIENLGGAAESNAPTPPPESRAYAMSSAERSE